MREPVFWAEEIFSPPVDLAESSEVDDFWVSETVLAESEVFSEVFWAESAGF